MEEIKRKFNNLNRIDLFFIVGGLIEVFCFAFLFDSFLPLLIGFITLITAVLPLKEERLKWNYFVGIWALIKYNPLTMALFSFIMSDIMLSYNSTTFTMIVGILLLFTGLASLVIGIILLVKTTKYLRLQGQ